MSKRLGWFLAGGLLVALLLAGVVSNFASGSPDGLDATARQGCTFNAAGRDHRRHLHGSSRSRTTSWPDSPLADYGIRGIDNPYLSTGLSGVLGVLLTFGDRRRRVLAGPPAHRRGGLSGRGPRPPAAPGPAEPGAPARARGEDRRRRVLFTIVVVVTPRTEFAAFGGYALLLAVVAGAGPGAGRRGWLKRATIELPFVLLAVALPFAGHGRAGRLAGPVAVGRRPATARGTSSPRAPSACSPRCCWPPPPRCAT